METNKQIIVDYFGNELHVGDWVTFMQTKYLNFIDGQIKSISEKGSLLISHEEINTCNTQTRQHCSRVFKCPDNYNTI